MNKIIIYSHAGSTNHGCEALLRTTVAFCPEKPRVYSIHGDDALYGADKICDYRTVKFFNSKSLIHYFLRALAFFDKNKMIYTKYWYKGFKKENKTKPAKVAISIGGDAYCYGNNAMLYSQNLFFNNQGIKTILWGCSIEPTLFCDAELIKDLNRYSLIIARESITKEALDKANLKTKVIYIPDPAFSLEKSPINLYHDYTNVVGINISPMIISHEKKKGITIDNYCFLIERLIEIGYNIALIPHVVSSNGSDIYILKVLYEKYKETKKIWIVDSEGKMNCMQLKYIISNCKMFIAARTHASIAAYSSNVPTLVVGYSVKSKGIAKDLFGEYDNYVLPVEFLSNNDDLFNKFKYIINNYDSIKTNLNKKNREFSIILKEYTKYLNEFIK